MIKIVLYLKSKNFFSKIYYLYIFSAADYTEKNLLQLTALVQ
jgi:hypothetical protein